MKFRTIMLSGGLAIASAGGCSEEPTGPVLPATGSLHLVMRTTGATLDPDGYVAHVGAARAVPVAVQDSVVVGAVEVGTYSVALDGLEPNCQASPSGHSTTIEPGAVVVLRFAIDCRGVLRDAVLFTVTDGSGPGGIRVMEMSLDGSEVRERYVGSHARVSANGEEVVYAAVTAFGLRRARVDGVGGIVTLSTDFHSFPDWSPDGQRIAFTSFRSGEWQLYTMNRDGGDVRRLTASDRQEVAASWSPDGASILIGRDAGPSGNDLVVVQADGSGEVTIATGTGGPIAWSPDGTRLLYHDISQGNRIGIMNADGSQPRVVTDGPSVNSAVWSPDGTEIMFTRPGTGIFRVDASGLNPQLIAPADLAPTLDEWR